MRPLRTLCLALVLGMVGSAATASAQVQDIYKITGGVFGSHADYHDVTIAPGQEMVLADVSGAGKITYMYFTDFKMTSIYPGLVLKIYWDDNPFPSVDVPLSDFFGAMQSREVDFASVAMQTNHHNYMSYLPMPFSKRARIIIANDGDQAYHQLAAWGVDYETDPAYATQTSRLHAAWRRSNPTVDALHTLVDIKGRGQYVGNFYQLNTTYPGWWGEGDSIFEVDGKAITHTGGTEDEYGSTWGFDKTFASPYVGYIEDDHGHNRMYRWYLMNPVRFTASLKVQLQDQRYDKGQVKSADDVTSIAYWYQDGAHPAPPLQSFAERTAPSQAATYPAPQK